MKISDTELKKIDEALARLKSPRRNPARAKTISVKAAALFLKPRLREMQAQGFTLAELAEALSRRGLPVKPATLGRYLASSPAESKPDTPPAPSSGLGGKISSSSMSAEPPPARPNPPAD